MPPSFKKANIDLQSHSAGCEIRTLSELIEFNARQNADYPFCVQAKKEGPSASSTFLTCSHLQLKQAILQCSAWLLTTVAELKLPFKSGDDEVTKGAPIALLVESDVGLLIYKLSLIGLGVPVLLLSARLSATAIHHLLKETGTRAIIVTPRLKNTANEALSLFLTTEHPPALYTQSSYDTFLGSCGGDDRHDDGSICAPGHYIDENDRDVLILHSSGTTGLPKPIYVSHKHLLCFTVCHDFASDEEEQGLNLSTLPLYHGFGLVAPGLSLGVGKKFCIPAPSVIPTGASIIELLKVAGARSLMTVPSILEEITFLPDEKGVSALVPLQFVAFGGGSLKPMVGEKLAAAGVRVLNHYGTTETGPLAPIFVPKADYDWRYFRLRKDMDLTVTPLPPSEDGVQRYTLIARPFGLGTTFQIQDELITNPRNPMIDFNAVGRNDDLIVLATGEKVLPRILESSLSESELVTAAVAFGEGQFELGVIVQPSSTLPPDQYDHFKSLIWPIIREAGDRMDAHARISSKDAIIIVPPGTILPRSDKGSIMRRGVYKMFEAEIAKTYDDLENSISDLLQPLSMHNLEQDLKNLIQARLNWKIPAAEWSLDDDLFDLGMDSLQAVQLRRYLTRSMPKPSGLSSASERITRDFVHQHPSVTMMANALRVSEGLHRSTSTRCDLVGDFVEQYSIKSSDSMANPKDGAVVLLTGSTGSLGTYLLAHLAAAPNVTRVICLNRPSADARSNSDPYVRQLSSTKSKCINISQEAWSKVEILQSNAALPSLGLTGTQYTHIRGKITHILHNAWPMDFKRGLPSFKSQFQTLQNLLNLALDAHSVQPSIRPKLLFVSSIAVVGRYPLIHGKPIIPEIPMKDEQCTNKIGYAEAKLVCERVLERAAHDYADQIDVTYVRVGQMSGSGKTGFWNTDEHLAALIRSSQLIGALPHLNGTFSWIPLDSAAEALSDLLLTSRPTTLVYHLENPIRQSWHDVLALLVSELNIPTPGFLPFDEWLDKVCAVAGVTADKNPAKKLVEFFKTDFQHMACGNVILDTRRMMDVSPTLRGMSVVGQETVAAYVRYWKSVGFLI